VRVLIKRKAGFFEVWDSALLESVCVFARRNDEAIPIAGAGLQPGLECSGASYKLAPAG